MLSSTARIFSAFAVLLCTCSGVAAAAESPLVAKATMQVPGKPLAKFDISAANANAGLYALSDRSNASVDFFNTRTRQFAWRAKGFAGEQGGPATAGPNGLAFVGQQQLWAGDGNSSVKIVDLASHHVVASIDTGGRKRVDELAYDPRDKIVLAANNADKPPFFSVISTKAPDRVVGRITMTQATDGLEQPVWDPETHLFYVAVPVLDGKPSHGGIAVINPRTRKILRIDALRSCEPAGLALGPHQHLLAGCSDDAVAHGFAAKSIVLDARSGRVLATFHQVGGSDEVAYDKQAHAFDLAAVANPGGPVLGVIDAASDKWMGNLPSGPHAHSVAADGKTGDVFVPVAASPQDHICPSGCIRIYAPRK